MKVGELTVRYQIKLVFWQIDKVRLIFQISGFLYPQKSISVEQKRTQKSIFANVLAKTLQKFEIILIFWRFIK